MIIGTQKRAILLTTAQLRVSGFGFRGPITAMAAGFRFERRLPGFRFRVGEPKADENPEP